MYCDAVVDHHTVRAAAVCAFRERVCVCVCRESESADGVLCEMRRGKMRDRRMTQMSLLWGQGTVQTG